jgi:phage terminase large subunit-like protein
VLIISSHHHLSSEQGSYIFSCQQLLKPVATEDQEFKMEWLRYYDELPPIVRKVLICDPANEKKKDSDFTVMGVVGFDGQNNRYLLDMIRDKLGLYERWIAYRDFWLLHHPDASGYEKYGKDADISYFEEKQREEGIHFTITPLGGNVSKLDRIRSNLIPIFAAGRFNLPIASCIRARTSSKCSWTRNIISFPSASTTTSWTPRPATATRRSITPTPALWMIMCRNGFVRVFPDKDTGMYLLDKDKKPVTPKGDVGTESVLPFNMEVPLGENIPEEEVLDRHQEP